MELDGARCHGNHFIYPAAVGADIHVPPLFSKNKERKRRNMVQRTDSFTSGYNKPIIGHEYDFRRSPESRMSSRKLTKTPLRPYVPLETALSTNDEGCGIVKLPNKTELGKHSKLVPNCQTLTSQPPVTSELLQEQRTYTGTCVAKVTTDTNGSDTFQEFELPTPRRNFLAPKTRISKKYAVFLSDHEIEANSLTPTPSQPFSLTENVIRFYFQHKMDKNKRIVRWLEDCEEKTCLSSLPALLPDITATRKNSSLMAQ